MRPYISSRMVVCAAFLTALWTASFPLLTAGGSLSDQKYLIDIWGADEGLPQSGATAIVQTPDGYLWFGTFGGLVRFDGVNFTVFDRANTPELPSPAIINMYLDRSGRLWISTTRGTAYVKDGQWRVFREGSGWIGNYVRFFAEAPSGQLYVTTFDNKLLRFRGERFEEMPLPPVDRKLGFLPYIDEAGDLWVVNPHFIGKLIDGKWHETISAASLLKQEPASASEWIMAGTGRDGGLWIATTQHLRKYKAGQLVFEVRAPWPMRDFWNLHEDSRGNVWICSWNAGLYQYSPEGDWHHYTSQNGLSNNFVRDLLEDREGNLWIGTDNGGLIRFKHRNFVNWGTAEGVPGNEIFSVAVDGRSRVFIGTRTHGVVMIQDGKATPFLRPGELKSHADAVLSLLVDHKERLWVGTLEDGLYLVDHAADQNFSVDSRSHSRTPVVKQGPIYSLFEDSRGRIWIGKRRAGILFDGKQFKEFPLATAGQFSAIFTFAEDPQSGTLWAGSTSGGLFRLQGDQFVPVPEAHELDGEPISFLRAENDGTLWMSTESGIACLRKGRLTRISDKQGIPSRSLGGILDDGQGNFWLASNRGILRVSRADLEAVIDGRRSALATQVFDRSDGLATVDCVTGNQHTVAKDAKGRLWFLTAKGAVTLDPGSFRLNTKPPILAIQDMLVDDQSTGRPKQLVTSAAPPPLSLVIPPGSHRLEIHYAALSFTSPSKIRYRYRLERVGKDLGKEWIDIGDHRVVYLQDLKPGSYRFRITAANNDGVWSDAGAITELHWKPHFYQSYWFFGLCVLGMALASTGAYRLRIRHVRTREIQLEKLVSQQTRELKEEVEVRKRAEAALSQARDELEDRVRQRTAELAAANTALEADIQKRQKVEEELRRSEDKFARAFHSSPAAMSISALDTGQVIDVNEAFQKMFGYSREESIGRTAAELQTWTDSPDRQHVVSLLREHGPVRNLEARFRTSTGKVFEALYSADIIHFGGKECLLTVILDITEQKRLEEQLRQSQKMEALGQLAGGVAHDFNNLLEVIIGYSELLADAEESNTPKKGQIQQVQKAAERAAGLTRQLLAFSRKQVLQPTVLDLNTAVSETEKLLRRVIGESIEFTTRLDSELGMVRADRGQMEQVILNLCVNARDAMPGGGKLTIETTNADLDDAYARSHPGAAPGSYVMLSVSDTGIGMDSVTRARIFEPFFTTKERGKGTGLGLSTVYGIVRQSGGHIWVYSEPKHGTTFKIYLPRVPWTSAVRGPLRAPSAPAGGSETILLVEDDETVRKLVSDALSSRGYQVLLAPSAEVALEMGRKFVEPIHMLVTDMVMPGKGGAELARDLLCSRPDLKILYVSGYTGGQFADTRDGAAFLQKPFTMQALAGKVREVLDTLPPKL